MPDILLLLLVGSAVLLLVLLADRAFDRWLAGRAGGRPAEDVEMLACECGRHLLARRDARWMSYSPGGEMHLHTAERCQPSREAIWEPDDGAEDAQ